MSHTRILKFKWSDSYQLLLIKTSRVIGMFNRLVAELQVNRGPSSYLKTTSQTQARNTSNFIQVPAVSENKNQTDSRDVIFQEVGLAISPPRERFWQVGTYSVIITIIPIYYRISHPTLCTRDPHKLHSLLQVLSVISSRIFK